MLAIINRLVWWDTATLVTPATPVIYLFKNTDKDALVCDFVFRFLPGSRKLSLTYHVQDININCLLIGAGKIFKYLLNLKPGELEMCSRQQLQRRTAVSSFGKFDV
jgi:hypothetical protein